VKLVWDESAWADYVWWQGQGYWSRRITEEHRLVSKVAEGEIRIAACGYHYER
jgi:toxin YoeB